MQLLNNYLSSLSYITDRHALFDVWNGAQEFHWWFDAEAMLVAEFANLVEFICRIF